MVAFISGSSRGIGKAIAFEFAKRGIDVAINYIGSAEEAEKAADECRVFGVNAETYKCDVSDFDACDQTIKKVAETLGSPDILINNAGITRDGLIARMKEEQFDDVYKTNLKSAYNLSRQCVPLMMKKRYGRIVNISSIAGIYGNPGQCNYSAMKAGLIGFTKSLSKELGSRNITVNAVAPGMINTIMTDVLPDKVKETAINSISLRRIGEASEIAKVVAFLASDDASYITGQCIGVDGGMSL